MQREGGEEIDGRDSEKVGTSAEAAVAEQEVADVAWRFLHLHNSITLVRSQKVFSTNSGFVIF